MIVELVLGGLFAAVGVRASWASLSDAGMGGTGRDRALVAIHDAAKAGFWFALGGLFFGFALVEDPVEFRWFALVPIGMAGVRLGAAALLARSPG